MLSQLNFAKVNGREFASFGESYSYSGAPKINVKEIPEHIQKLIDELDQNLPSKTLFPLVSRIQNPLTYLTFSISEARSLSSHCDSYYKSKACIKPDGFWQSKHS